VLLISESWINSSICFQTFISFFLSIFHQTKNYNFLLSSLLKVALSEVFLSRWNNRPASCSTEPYTIRLSSISLRHIFILFSYRHSLSSGHFPSGSRNKIYIPYITQPKRYPTSGFEVPHKYRQHHKLPQKYLLRTSRRIQRKLNSETLQNVPSKCRIKNFKGKLVNGINCTKPINIPW
jgi:hypothetical protein